MFWRNLKIKYLMWCLSRVHILSNDTLYLSEGGKVTRWKVFKLKVRTWFYKILL